MNYCIDCYESKHRIILRKHRRKISRKKSSKKISNSFVPSYKVCSTCQAESLIVDRSGVEVCKNCEKTLKINKKMKHNEAICPVCSSVNYEKKGFRNGKQRYMCKDCGRSWTSGGAVKNTISTKTKQENIFKAENTPEEIIAYLKDQEKYNKPLVFWYRDDINPRITYDYFIDEKYVQVRADEGYYIKFLIDKIRKI